MKPEPNGLIALLTDFGTGDWYAGVMHAEMLARAPAARVIDMTHAVPPGRVVAGAFALRAALPSLPAGTVVCAVVDPGVGTARAALCGQVGPYFWSGPDNGLLTPLLDRAGPEDAVELFRIEHEPWRRAEPGATFHGRDYFAPAAARLALGEDFRAAGAPAPPPVRLELPVPAREADHQWRGEVVWVDHFGNLITNFKAQFAQNLKPGDWVMRAGGLVAAAAPTFGAVAAGAPLFYAGSAGYLEMGLHGGNAARQAGVGLGDPAYLVNVTKGLSS